MSDSAKPDRVGATPDTLPVPEPMQVTASPASTTASAAAPAEAEDLRLVALTPRRSHLILEGSDARQYRMPVDQRLAAALRAPDRPRTGQLEIALESQLTPREIQARVRAGHSVDEVAAMAGISTERVERYASPVLAERAHVVDQAQRAPARRASNGTAPSLGETVARRLTDQQVAADSVTWDAWRGEDDRWIVRLTYLAAGRERFASWAFDPRGRVLAAADDESRWLVEGSGVDREADEPATAVRRLAAVPHAEETATDSLHPADQVYDREADERTKAESGHDRTADPARPPASGASVRGRRQPVPSWDDIMFGPRRES